MSEVLNDVEPPCMPRTRSARRKRRRVLEDVIDDEKEESDTPLCESYDGNSANSTSPLSTPQAKIGDDSNVTEPTPHNHTSRGKLHAIAATRPATKIATSPPPERSRKRRAKSAHGNCNQHDNYDVDEDDNYNDPTYIATGAQHHKDTSAAPVKKIRSRRTNEKSSGHASPASSTAAAPTSGDSRNDRRGKRPQRGQGRGRRVTRSASLYGNSSVANDDTISEYSENGDNSELGCSAENGNTAAVSADDNDNGNTTAAVSTDDNDPVAFNTSENTKASELVSDDAEDLSTLERLLNKSEKYTSHILARRDSDSSSKIAPKRSKRMTERDEDYMLVREAEEEFRGYRHHTRLVKQPRLISGGVLRPWQMEGLNWLIGLNESRLNGMLADEMGLGKTLQTIALLAWLREAQGIKGPHLIIGPKSTLGNWSNEFNKFCPKLNVLKFHGDKETRENLKKNELSASKRHALEVVITSYEMCLRESTIFQKIRWRYVVIDEAHRLKNDASKLSCVVRTLKTNFRLLLTGTPLQNNLKELWALLNFLFPEVFSSSEEFETLFDVTAIDNELSTKQREMRNAEVVARLHKVLRPFMLRRVKSEVMREMPPKHELLLFIPFSAMQRDLYRVLLSKNVDALHDTSGGRVRLLNLAMQLRKACNHPYLFEGYEDPALDPCGEHIITNSGKMVFLDKLLARLIERGSRILIFTQMTRVLDILEDYCRMRNHRYCRLDGNTGAEERDSQIELFNSENSSKKIFLLSTRAGGLGINLATADTVVLYDSDWNPQVDLQAMDRAHRIGQTKPVNVYRFVHEHSVEEKIIEKATLKLQLDSAIIQQGRLSEKQRQLKKSELMEMIQFGADQIFKAGSNLDLSDADVEAILESGARRTALMNEKIQQQVKKSILDFSVNSSSSNLYKYEGVDYTDIQKQADRRAWASFGLAAMEEERERSSKRRVRVLHEQLEAIHKVQMTPKPSKLPLMHEWQFYEKDAIVQIHEAEQRHLNNEEASDDFPPELRERKIELVSQGFGEWTKKDFLGFIRGCELYGRNNLEKVSLEVPAKSLEDVKLYSEVFWKRYAELNEWEKWIRRINTGELAIEKRKAQEDIIRRKQEAYKCPERQLVVPYPGGKCRAPFSDEEDRWLLNMTTILGYGNWEQIQHLARRDFMWRFGWFLRSRTAGEIGKRVEHLTRLLKREEEQLAKKATEVPLGNTPPRNKGTPTNEKSPPTPAARRSRKAAQPRASLHNNTASHRSDRNCPATQPLEACPPAAHAASEARPNISPADVELVHPLCSAEIHPNVAIVG